MSFREKRSDNARAIAEGRFIKMTLENEGKEINQAIDSVVNGFNSAFWKNKSFKVVGGNSLEYRHQKQHRWLDMKYRESASKGKIRKKRRIIHNKIIYGHLNNIVKELSYGFTDAVIQDLKRLESN